MRFSRAFTMIELVFVIVVLGILAAVALPKMGPIVEDAKVASGKADVMAIRSAILAERQKRIIKGDSSYINRLDAGVAINTAGVNLFDSNTTLSATSPRLLSTPIKSGTTDGHWVKTGNNVYAYKVGGNNISFTYYPTNGTNGAGDFMPAGTFDCDHANDVCKRLTE